MVQFKLSQFTFINIKLEVSIVIAWNIKLVSPAKFYTGKHKAFLSRAQFVNFLAKFTNCEAHFNTWTISTDGCVIFHIDISYRRHLRVKIMYSVILYGCGPIVLWFCRPVARIDELNLCAQLNMLADAQWYFLWPCVPFAWLLARYLGGPKKQTKKKTNEMKTLWCFETQIHRNHSPPV